MLRPLHAAIAALALSPAALAQTTNTSGSATFSPSTQQVQFVAPQLIPFAGSTGNFESLVSGLTSGTAVTLATVGADGSPQTVTFTPSKAGPAGGAGGPPHTARRTPIAARAPDRPA